MTPIAIMHKVGNENELPTLPASFDNPDTRPQWVPSSLVTLVRQCLAFKPADRPTFKMICDILKPMKYEPPKV